jgi:hypothetical protein
VSKSERDEEEEPRKEPAKDYYAAITLVAIRIQVPKIY